MKRREVIQRMIAGTGTAVFIPISLLSCSEDLNGGDNTLVGKTVEINLDDSAFAALNNEGGFLMNSGLIIANTGAGGFVALSNVCTHKGCIVTYDDPVKNFPCDCHGSVYSTSGSVIQGPATRSLKKYEVNRIDNILIIKTS